MGIKIIKSKEEFLYYFFYSIEGLLIILAIMNAIHPLNLKMEGVVCEYNTLTGNKCFGCGATHAINLLIGLNFIRSAEYNCTFVVALMLMINYQICYKHGYGSKLIALEYMSADLLVGMLIVLTFLYNCSRIELPGLLIIGITLAITKIMDVMVKCGAPKECLVTMTVVTLIVAVAMRIAGGPANGYSDYFKKEYLIAMIMMTLIIYVIGRLNASCKCEERATV